MVLIPDLFESKFEDHPVNDLIVALHHIADKSETHVAFKENVPEYVTRPAGLRDMADKLGQLRDAAAGGDREMTAAKKALMATSAKALSMNAVHIVLLSMYRNDPDILLNAGFEPKQKTAIKTAVNLLDLVPQVDAKHGPRPGCASLHIKRVKQTASIELQINSGDPQVESSWTSRGVHHQSRIEINGLTPATRVYFRARYHDKGDVGRWSTPVELIII